jgi:hypothetical protein
VEDRRRRGEKWRIEEAERGKWRIKGGGERSGGLKEAGREVED